jgi:hypothetical protein
MPTPSPPLVVADPAEGKQLPHQPLFNAEQLAHLPGRDTIQ